MKRYKITMEYLGTNFRGWQKQKNNRSIQETFEKAAKELLQEEVNSIVAGRTDAGVHASGQVIHVDIKKKINDVNLLMGLNFYLSKENYGTDVCVRAVKKVSKNFNARFSATKKHYQYKIFNSNFRSPFHHSSTWWVRKRLDIDAMQRGSLELIGDNDYSSFRAKGCQASSPIKSISKVDVKKKKDLIVIDFFAKSFLYNQVRIMVGTLKDVGVGYTKPLEIANILSKKNRKFAGVTAPAKGLTLKRVFYK